MTGARPVRVTAMPVFAPEQGPYNCRHVGDRSAILTCLNDDNSVFRIIGWSSYGAKEDSFRICGTKGQIENIRGSEGRILLRYNEWDVPAGEPCERTYQADWPSDCRTLIGKCGLGADYFVIRTFFNCIHSGKQPEMDV